MTTFQDQPCDRCGERLGDEPVAELIAPNYPDEGKPFDPADSKLVHAEPCAEELLRKGWTMA